MLLFPCINTLHASLASTDSHPEIVKYPSALPICRGRVKGFVLTADIINFPFSLLPLIPAEKVYLASEVVHYRKDVVFECNSCVTVRCAAGLRANCS